MNEVRCVVRSCRNYDAQTWVDWTMEQYDPGDPPEDKSLLFRDFCQQCTTSQDFDRKPMPYSDSLCAYCPDCGRPNYWAGPPKFDDEADTEPFGKMLKEYLDDDTAD
jgi:hypothetical protein